MANEVVTLVLSRRFGSTIRKAVAHVLADHADGDTYSTFVGQKKIAAEAEMTDRTVRSVLADFESEGLIVREKRYRTGYGRGRTSDLITLVRESILNLPEAISGNDEIPEPHADLPESDAYLPESHDRFTGNSFSAQEPSENHQIEPSVRTAAQTEIRDDLKSDPQTGLTIWNNPTTGKQARREDLLWEMAEELWGKPATDTEHGRRNREIRELRKAGVHPTELAELFAIAVKRWEKKPGIAGLIRNLGDLRSGLEIGPGFIDELETRQRHQRMEETVRRLEAQRKGLPG